MLIAVQFASVTAHAHAGLSHVPDGHSLHDSGRHDHGLHDHGAAGGVAHSVSHRPAAAESAAGPALPAAQAATAAQDIRIAAASSDACVIGCCGNGMGCCGHALASVSPNLPPRGDTLRIGFARLASVREVDPRGLRKPPRILA